MGCAPMTLFRLGWAWLGMGLLTGTVLGLFFASDTWLGGYSSWPRRMLRLGHISFFGTGGLALAAHFSTVAQGTPSLATLGFTLGALSMPTVCALSAYHKPLRHLFFIPVSSLLLGAAAVLQQVMS